MIVQKVQLFLSFLIRQFTAFSHSDSATPGLRVNKKVPSWLQVSLFRTVQPHQQRGNKSDV
jgi:hypothetical protein